MINIINLTLSFQLYFKELLGIHSNPCNAQKNLYNFPPSVEKQLEKKVSLYLDLSMVPKMEQHPLKHYLINDLHVAKLKN